jgi:hypothetical protein
MKTTFMRRSELMAWLADMGVSKHKVREMIEAGSIVRMYVPGMVKGRALYSRAQVERDVLGGALGGEG